MIARCLAYLLLAAPAWAAVDGTVVNGTSGKPGAGVPVMLVQPGAGGMKTMGQTKSDAGGKFSFEQLAPVQGPQLVQAIYKGVTYTKALIPGTPTTGLQVEIFDSTRKPIAKMAQHMILLQPGPSGLSINEMMLFEDTSKLTYSDPEGGTVKFYVPDGALEGPKVSFAFNAPGGMSMPVTRPAEKTKQANVYKAEYAIKPGETRMDLQYVLPATTPLTFSSKVLSKEGKTRLVVPNGVTLKGANIQEIGKEPQTQATIYDLTGDAIAVTIEGAGALEPAPAAGDQDTGQPTIEQSPPHIYDKLYWILGLALGVLALGTVLLLARPPAQPAPTKR